MRAQNSGKEQKHLETTRASNVVFEHKWLETQPTCRALEEEDNSFGHTQIDLCLDQHVVQTCGDSTKPRPDRSRVNGLRSEELAQRKSKNLEMKPVRF